MVFPFDGVYHGKVHLYGTSFLVLIYFGALIFKPVFHFSVFVSGDAGYIRFTLFRNPMNSIRRTLVKGDSSQRIIHYQVVLQWVTPYYRIFKFAFHIGVGTLFGYLVIRRSTGTAYPYATTTAYHQAGAVLPAGKGQVGQPFYNLSVARVEIELFEFPWTIHTVGYVVTIDDINHNTTVC